MDQEQIKAILENVLFVADSPVPAERLVALFEGEVSAEEAQEALIALRDDYEPRALQLVEVAEGWRIQTRPEYAEYITRFFKIEKGSKLGRAALEGLAIIAYRQPITRAEVDEIRGVDSGAALRGLIDKGLVKTMGRRKTPGRPMMYGTTKRFLEYFGLARLGDLPTMDEFASELADGLPGADDGQERMAFDYEAGAPAPEEDLAFSPENEAANTDDEPTQKIEIDESLGAEFDEPEKNDDEDETPVAYDEPTYEESSDDDEPTDR